MAYQSRNAEIKMKPVQDKEVETAFYICGKLMRYLLQMFLLIYVYFVVYLVTLSIEFSLCLTNQVLCHEDIIAISCR